LTTVVLADLDEVEFVYNTFKLLTVSAFGGGAFSLKDRIRELSDDSTLRVDANAELYPETTFALLVSVFLVVLSVELLMLSLEEVIAFDGVLVTRECAKSRSKLLRLGINRQFSLLPPPILLSLLDFFGVFDGVIAFEDRP
jgi:hypothetical protein